LFVVELLLCSFDMFSSGIGGFSFLNRYTYDSDDSEGENKQSALQPKSYSAADEESNNDKLINALDNEENNPTENILVSADELLGTENINESISKLSEHMCTECEDQPAELLCEQCSDKYCSTCYNALHKKANRAKHSTKQIENPLLQNKAISNKNKNTSVAEELESKESGMELSGNNEAASPLSDDSNAINRNIKDRNTENLSSDDEELSDSESSVTSSQPRSSAANQLLKQYSGPWFEHRSKFIPLRLSLEERKVLRLVEAALSVSEYTDKIDIISNKDKVKRIQEQLRDICSILSGLVVASDYKLGQQLVKDREFHENEEFFQAVFEIGRRHKIRNPEKMRATYGKMIFILQDAQIPQIQELLQFSLVRPIKSVYSRLKDAGSIEMLYDSRLELATGEIRAESKPRRQIDYEIKQKNQAIDYLARNYSNNNISKEEVENCIRSIGDNHSYLTQNRNSCDVMLGYLTRYFTANAITQPYSLAIMMGKSGARLSHSHAQQYTYVLQSLTLWREILHNMFELWQLSEDDLLDKQNPYRLRNTGQGLNRVQSAPRVGRIMHNILYSCQKKLGSWIGSSVIHLGDHNVPNSLVFIDKYNQVSRILNPIVLTLKAIDAMVSKPDLRSYLDKTFGGVEPCKLLILTDFFRHAFDGSGSDNFFDAGSCIDGRLTSAWNWCSTIEKKAYYNVFLLAGFQGFDGEFNG
jgi:hypothetical protein